MFNWTTARIATVAWYKHRIDFVPGSSLLNLAHYKMHPKEVKFCIRLWKICLKKNWSNRTKRMDHRKMCVYSRTINKITIKYHFPIPRFKDLLDHLSSTTIFSKLDLRGRYHQIHIQPGNEWKTAFKTSEGLFERKMMPFGLCNAPSTFMKLMTEVLKPFLIYSSSWEEHLVHLK